MVNRKNMFLAIIIALCMLIVACTNTSKVFATNNDTIYIYLSDSNITVDDENISEVQI